LVLWVRPMLGCVITHHLVEEEMFLGKISLGNRNERGREGEKEGGTVKRCKKGGIKVAILRGRTWRKKSSRSNFTQKTEWLEGWKKKRREGAEWDRW